MAEDMNLMKWLLYIGGREKKRTLSQTVGGIHGIIISCLFMRRRYLYCLCYVTAIPLLYYWFGNRLIQERAFTESWFLVLFCIWWCEFSYQLYEERLPELYQFAQWCVSVWYIQHIYFHGTHYSWVTQRSSLLVHSETWGRGGDYCKHQLSVYLCSKQFCRQKCEY